MDGFLLFFKQKLIDNKDLLSGTDGWRVLKRCAQCKLQNSNQVLNREKGSLFTWLNTRRDWKRKRS